MEDNKNKLTFWRTWAIVCMVLLLNEEAGRRGR